MITNTHILIAIVAQSVLILFLYDLNRERIIQINKRQSRIAGNIIRLRMRKRKTLYEYKTLQVVASEFEKEFNELLKQDYTPCSEMVVLSSNHYYIIQQFKRKKIQDEINKNFNQ